MASDDRSDAALVAAVRNGDRDAYGVLFERWFNGVYDVARNIVRNPETAADVAQDTFIAAWERLDRLENVDAFGGWLLRSARNRALDRLERDGRSRPQADDVVTGLHDRGAPDLVGSRRTLDPEAISAGHDRDGLIAAAAVALGERDASILDLHLRHGLTPAEIATELGVTPNNAHQLLFRMRNKLGDAIGAYVLWHRGRPACATLRSGVASVFDADTFATVERHRRKCDECTQRRAALVAPEQLFSAAPLLVAPLLIRTSVRDAVQSAGVPVQELEHGSQAPADHQPPDATRTSQMPTGQSPDPTSNSPGSSDATNSDDDHGDIDAGRSDDDDRGRRRPALLAVAASVVVLLVAAGVTIALDDSDPASTAATVTIVATTEPSPAAPASTGATTSTTTSTSLPPTQARAGTVPAVDDLAPAPIEPTTTPAAPRVTPPTTGPPEAPPVTAPPAAIPTTTEPSPPSTPPATPSTTLPASTVPPPAPAIVRLFFGNAPAGVLCSGARSPRRIGWSATEATAATLAVGSSTRTVAVSGQLDTCVTSGDLVTLTVTGPGGAASDSIVAP